MSSASTAQRHTAPRDPPAVAAIVRADTTLPTPWFTRHMPGAIEAERDRRRVARATHPRRESGRAAMAHPRLAAAISAEASRLTERRADYSRWADEGGRYDPEAAARLRIGNRRMKRCSS